MTDNIANTTRGLTADTAGKPKSIRDLTIVELEAVSGGCQNCTRNNQEPGCTCKPSPRIP